MSKEKPPVERDCRFALVLALQVLTHTSPEKLADLYEIAYGERIEKARAAAHASILAKKYETLLKEFDWRHGTGPDQTAMQKGFH